MSLLPEDAEDDTFECDMEGVPVDRTNLVLRAVDIFRERCGFFAFATKSKSFF